MKNMSFINVAGFFSSGSSAVVDLVKEYKDTYECNAEIRLIKDPYGISQLERALVDDWELINSAAAIRDFLWLCKICNRNSNTPFSPVGLSYAKKITPEFMKLTNDYIVELTQYTYVSDFYYQKFKKKYFQYVVDRWRMGIEFYSKGKIYIANRKLEESVFSHPTREQFYRATTKYLERLFQNCIGNSDGGYIILDQAVSPNNPEVIHKYFKHAKLIIVDRDPRDMYIEDVEHWRENLDKDTVSKEAGRRYVLKHKALRCNIPQDDEDVLVIKFEELVLDYEQVVSQIENFLGFNMKDHIYPRKFLKPEYSAKNIGIWKQYYSKYRDAIDIISEELKEYCYDVGEVR